MNRIVSRLFNSEFGLTRFFLFLMVVLVVFQTALASAPLVKTQAPGYFRMTLGDFEVTALYDGPAGFGTDVLTNADPKDVRALLERGFLPKNGLSVSVNAFLINTGKQLILVDTGAGVFWPGLGALMNNLKLAGYAPEQVDLVLLTHLHVDHDGGLLTADGKCAFPNADVRMAQAESDFWLSETNQQNAPEAAKGMFDIARATLSAYQARWKPFNGDGELAPGVKPVPLPGHTVGHTGYEITSNGDTLLIWGDIVHSAAVQLPEPDVAFAFDTDSKMAVDTRRNLFDRVVKEGLMVAGAHMPFPGIGHLLKINGSVQWVPVQYKTLP